MLEGEEMKKQMTPWFPAKIKPVRAGVYETKWFCVDECEHGFSYWNGSIWANSSTSPKSAYGHKNWTSGAVQSKKWRGFTEEQK